VNVGLSKEPILYTELIKRTELVVEIDDDLVGNERDPVCNDNC